MGEIEFDKCQICGQYAQIHRTYFRYPEIKCECHSPCHFDLVRHCDKCKPRIPEYTRIELRTDNLKVEVD